jgi:hypothetical protein
VKTKAYTLDSGSNVTYQQIHDGGSRHFDSACSCLTNRFKSPAFQIARNIESLMIGCINTDNTDQASSVLPNILSLYGNDIDGNRLLLQLSMLIT